MPRLRPGYGIRGQLQDGPSKRQVGGEITMVMIRGQELVHLTRPGGKDNPEVWRRCKPIS